MLSIMIRFHLSIFVDGISSHSLLIKLIMVNRSEDLSVMNLDVYCKSIKICQCDLYITLQEMTILLKSHHQVTVTDCVQYVTHFVLKSDVFLIRPSVGSDDVRGSSCLSFLKRYFFFPGKR